MSLVTSLYNKVQYLVSKNLSDPEADRYARQQAQQAKQDAEARAREQEAARKREEDAAKKAEDDKNASRLSSRSKFSVTQIIGDASNGILKALGSVIFILIFIYGGHISANDAIGYKIPFRILSFIYGGIFSFYVIPNALYRIYGKGETLPYYSFLPLSTYLPTGKFESIFLGPFCFQEDENSLAARRAVETLYSDAYNKSIEK